VPISQDETPDGRAARLAYYEARKLNNPPTSLLDYHDAKRVSSRQPSATLANNARTPLPDRPAAIKHVAFPPEHDSDPLCVFPVRARQQSLVATAHSVPPSAPTPGLHPAAYQEEHQREERRRREEKADR
jgi:hypothetical protein